MGMIVYHKISAEITGPDGREWMVSVEPPTEAAPPGKPTGWQVEIKRLFTREELARLGGEEPEPEKLTVPTHDGMFKALSIALDLVPRD